jgi:DNA-binding MarR family transcriptional regulator
MISKRQKIESIFSNFQNLRRALSAEGQEFHKGSGLTMTQMMVLMFIKKSGATTITEIAAKLGTTKSAATQLVDGLVEHNLIDRAQDNNDRRVVNITLSQNGQEYIHETKKKAMNRIAAVFEVLDDSELDCLESIARKLVKGIRG